MLIVRPDFARRIDLAGVGPCPRPVDVDRSHTGFVRLVALRVYSFAAGNVIDGEAEGDEVFIVLMRGRAAIAAFQADTPAGTFALGTDGGQRAVYLPPHAAYRLTARDDCDIAYARAQPPAAALRAVAGFAPLDGRLDVADHAGGMALMLETLAAGATIPSGGPAPERLVHVRSDGDGALIAAGERIGNWDSAALDDGEHVAFEIEKEKIDILTVSAIAG